jgi:DNA-binding NtrC family response regulator
MSALVVRRHGHEVRGGSNRAEAIKLCEQERFDRPISDLELPDGSGLDLMRAVAEKYNFNGIACAGY